MKLEFLVVVESGNSFCSNIESFKNFLQSDSDIKISSKKIWHRDYEVSFELQDGCNEEKGNKFYHLRLRCQDEKVGELSALGRAIKKCYINAPIMCRSYGMMLVFIIVRKAIL
jgi:hypothetical protein